MAQRFEQPGAGNVVPLRAGALKSGDGGGTFDGMEARVSRLEADISEIKSDIKKIGVDLSYLRGKVDAMPTTLQLLGFAVAVFVAAGVFRFFSH